jgi:hypothetical protein
MFRERFEGSYVRSIVCEPQGIEIIKTSVGHGFVCPGANSVADDNLFCLPDIRKLPHGLQEIHSQFAATHAKAA